MSIAKVEKQTQFFLTFPGLYTDDEFKGSIDNLSPKHLKQLSERIKPLSDQALMEISQVVQLQYTDAVQNLNPVVKATRVSLGSSIGCIGTAKFLATSAQLANYLMLAGKIFGGFFVAGSVGAIYISNKGEKVIHIGESTLSLSYHVRGKMEKVIKEIQDRFKSAEIEAGKEKLGDQEDQLRTHNRKIDEHDDEFVGQKGAIKTLKENDVSKDEKIQALTQENERRARAIETLEQKNMKQETKLQTQETKLQTQETKLQTQETKLQTQETKLQTQETKLQTQETELQTQASKIKSFEANFEALKHLLPQKTV